MEKQVEVKFVKLHKDAKMPSRGYAGDACYDFYTTTEVIIPARGFSEIDLGIAIELPEHYEMTFRSRSSFGRKGLQVHPGTIDSGYRGYLSVFIFNHTDAPY